MATQPTAFSVRFNSLNLAAARDGVWSATLEIQFHSGPDYEYDNVPPGIYAGLLAAESPGRFIINPSKITPPDRRML